jgi:hypothetical protein
METKIAAYEQAVVPKAGGGGNYGSRRFKVLLEAIEGALFVCPKSEKLIQFRLQKAWMIVNDRLVAGQRSVERQTAALWPEGV